MHSQRAMHPMFFSLKQTHIAVQRELTPLAKGYGLTPARFDLMRVVALYEWGIPQWKLVRLLGVAAPVISRMLKELTKLGFVRRYRNPHDRRVNIVHLTDEGAARLARAIRGEQWSGWLECITCELLCPKDDYASLETYKILNRARIRGKGRAPFLHPWRIANVFDENLQDIHLRLDDLDTSIPAKETEVMERALERPAPRRAA